MSGLVVFLPVNILKKLGLNDLPNVIRMIIGIAFLLSSVLIITIMLSIIFAPIFKLIQNRWIERNLKRRYTKLSQNQKEIINKLCKSKTKSIKLDITSGDTRYLVGRGFILSPQQVIAEDDLYSNLQVFSAQPWLIDFYEKKPEMFKTQENKILKGE